MAANPHLFHGVQNYADTRVVDSCDILLHLGYVYQTLYGYTLVIL